VGNRLLLFAASILREDIVSQQDAIALLKEKANQRELHSWPGLLVEYCLENGNIKLDLMDAKPGLEVRKAIVNFYRSLLEFNSGVLSRAQLNARMADIADISAQQWSEQDAFSRLIRKEEFFIARHESLADRLF
jgi:hypothetical protein